MNKGKRKRLEAKGWKIGTISEFLNLSPKEEAHIEAKLALREQASKKRIAYQPRHPEVRELYGYTKDRPIPDKKVLREILLQKHLSKSSSVSETVDKSMSTPKRKKK